MITDAQHRDAKQQDERPQGKCGFWIAMKHKYCTGSTVTVQGGDGVKFCSIHKPGRDERVPCPIDGRHDVRRLDLERHLRICPSAKVAKPDCYEPNVNVVSAPSSSVASLRIRDVPSAEGEAFFEWLRRRHSLLCGEGEGVPRPSWWRPRDATGDTFPTALVHYVSEGSQKHRLQQAVLAGMLEGLLQAPEGGYLPTGVVEIGAGKGGVGCVLKMLQPLWHIALVERAKYRDPKEKEINKSLKRNREVCETAAMERDNVNPIERIMIDARDFSAVRWMQDKSCERWGIVGKHLCGGCSDYALKAFGDIVLSLRGAPLIPSPHSRVAVVLATCCHHLCSCEAYLGSSTLPTTMGDGSQLPWFPTERHFELCRSICSWAVIGDQEHSYTNKHSENVPRTTIGVDPLDGDANSHVVRHWTNDISVDEKISLGRMAKTVIDAGRVLWLTSVSGASVEYVTYVDQTTSGECHAIVGTW